MDCALLEARKAFDTDEVPVGAVLVQNDKIIARAHNLMKKNKSVLCHAEMLCIEEASRLLNSPVLDDVDLYVTLEPCAMCAGAIAHSRIRRVYFAAYDVKGGFVDHQAKIFNFTLHKPEVYGGISEKESQDLLKLFFQSKRFPSHS